MPQDKAGEQLKNLNVALIEFVQKNVLVIKRNTSSSNSKNFDDVVVAEDIINGLASHNVHVKNVHFVKIIRSFGTHSVIADGEKIMLDIQRL